MVADFSLGARGACCAGRSRATGELEGRMMRNETDVPLEYYRYLKAVDMMLEKWKEAVDGETD